MATNIVILPKLFLDNFFEESGGADQFFKIPQLV